MHTATGGTRFALLVQVAAIVAAAGAAAAALAGSAPCLLPVAGLLRRRARRHSRVRRPRTRPRLTAVARGSRSICCTSASAAVWIGGLLALLAVLRRAASETTHSAEPRRAGSRPCALVAVGVLAASGVGRSLSELDSVGQLWSTSYGRALLVKTALFLPLLAVGRLNRRLLEQGHGPAAHAPCRSSSRGSS